MATLAKQPELEVLFDREQIAARVEDLGGEISRDLAGESVLLVGILKGAAIFLSDLSRSITADATFDFLGASSYGTGSRSSRTLRITKYLDMPVEDRNVILVEDILDTGTTVVFLRRLIEQHAPRSIRIAAFLDKPARRLEKVEADYVGFRIPNYFVVGYGMDYGERFRNLPDIHILPPTHPE